MKSGQSLYINCAEMVWYISPSICHTCACVYAPYDDAIRNVIKYTDLQFSVVIWLITLSLVTSNLMAQTEHREVIHRHTYTHTYSTFTKCVRMLLTRRTVHIIYIAMR